MNRDSAPQIPTSEIALQEVQRRIGQVWAKLPSADSAEALEITDELELDFNRYEPTKKEDM